MGSESSPRSTGFPGLLDEWEALCEALVAVDARPWRSVKASAERVARTLEAHCRSAGRGGSVRLAREHRWFLRSVAEVDALVAVLEAEDHGGHRQALGQYGRILAEALRKHLSEEDDPDPLRGDGSPRPSDGASEQR